MPRPKLQLSIINNADGLLVVVPFFPAEFKLIGLVLLPLIFSGFWAMIGGWEFVFLFSPVSIYASLVLALNRRELQISNEILRLSYRPLPVKFSSQFLRKEIECWVYGRSIHAADVNDPIEKTKIFTAGFERPDGSIVRFADRLPSFAQAKEIADRCAQHCSQQSEYRERMIGENEKPERSWVTYAEWIFIGGSILFACWKMFGER